MLISRWIRPLFANSLRPGRFHPDFLRHSLKPCKIFPAKHGPLSCDEGARAGRISTGIDTSGRIR